MKPIISTAFLCLSVAFFSIAQNSRWTKSAPFEQKVFVKNEGQYLKEDNGDNGKILFSTAQSGMNIFWNSKGLTYGINEHYLSEEAKREIEKGGDPDAMMEEMKIRKHFLNMEWLNGDPNVQIICEEPVSFYYTYPDPSENGSIKALAYKKIIYKNIYPGIDAEYILPEWGGIKYSIVVHPGADIAQVKMKYSDKVSLINGEMKILSSECGTFLEHEPIAYYEGGDTIASMFTLQKNKIGFSISSYDKTKTLIIDPLVTQISFPISMAPYNLSIKACQNVGFDVMYDDAGNVYVYGGGEPLNLGKYDASGSLKWVYSSTQYASDLIGDADVNKTTGTAYISEGFYGSGAHIDKIDAAGNLIKKFNGNNHNAEISRIRLTCSGQIITTGGGVGPPTGQPVPWQVCMVDTNLNAMTGMHITSSPNGDHDVNLMTLDPTGSFMYVNFNYPAPFSADYLNNNEMHKVPVGSWSPSAWMNPGPTFSFTEKSSLPYAGYSSGYGFRMNTFNGMVCGNGFLYTYNGDTLKKWDKNSGAFLKQVVTGGKRYWSGGIDLDLCENIYVGIGKSVEEYDPNLNLINTYQLPDTSVYDLKVDKLKNKIYATGNGFVCAIDLPAIVPPQLTTTFTPTSSGCGSNCTGTATATMSANCATFSYAYIWFPGGQTTSTITGLCPGTYTVIASTNLTCSKSIGDTAYVTIPSVSGNTVTATIASSPSQCSAGNGTATVTSTSGGVAPYTYLWSPSTQTNSTATGLSAGNYTVVVSDAGGCSTSQIVSITSTTITATAGPNSTICAGVSVSVSASGGGNYSWSTGNTSSSITVAPTSSITYSVIVSSGGCADTLSANVTVNPSPLVNLGNNQTVCSAQNSTLDAGNSGASYWWSTGATTQTIIVSGAGTYWVIAGTSNCLAKDTVSIFMAPQVHLFDSSLCTTSPIKLDAGSGATSYLWSNGSSSQNISVDVSGNYWVNVMYGNCMRTDTAQITGEPGGTGTLYIPNAFTPNGDHLNEIFSAKGEGIVSFDMKIFDRWGNLIFVSDNLNYGWNGNIQGGNYILKGDGNEPSQEDVYIWKINYTTQCFPEKIIHDMGHVSIVK